MCPCENSRAIEFLFLSHHLHIMNTFFASNYYSIYWEIVAKGITY